MVDHALVAELVALRPGEIDHPRACAAAGKAHVRHQRLTRAVHHAADNRQAHRCLDVLQPFFQGFHRLDHVEALPRAGGAGNDVHAPVPQAERLENLVADLHLFHRIGGKAHADRVANAHPQKVAEADGGFDRAGHQAARLRDTKVNGRIRSLRQLLVGGGGHEYVGGLAADFEFVKIVVLQDLDVIQPGFHHRVGTGLPVFFQEVPFQRSRVHADADGTSMIARRLDHLADALFIADVAGVDPQTGRPRLRRLDPAAVVEMDVRHDGNRAFRHDFPQCLRRRLIRDGNPHDVGPGIRRRLNLRDGAAHIRCQRVGHRLHGNRRIAPHGDIAHHDPARGTAFDVTPRANVIEAHQRVPRADWLGFAPT